jgi:methylated-DNA-[protein]-cysteine S-methyltransferase
MAGPIYYAVWESPVGALTFIASEYGLLGVEFGRKARQTGWMEYFAGQRREFTIPLDMRGTEFQLRCWRELLKIPYGQTRSYAELARAVGSPQGFRAVGHANGQNPIAIVVPCHRVIASDGSLGGYGGGLPLKEELLRLEGARLF